MSITDLPVIFEVVAVRLELTVSNPRDESVRSFGIIAVRCSDDCVPNRRSIYKHYFLSFLSHAFFFFFFVNGLC